MSSQKQPVPEREDDSYIGSMADVRDYLPVQPQQQHQNLPGKDFFAMLSSASSTGSQDGSSLPSSVPGKPSFAALRQRRNKAENEKSGDKHGSQSPQSPHALQGLPPSPEAEKTEHIIVETTEGIFFIISKLSTRKDVQLISIEPKLGTLKYKHRPQEDLFETVEDALDHIEVTLELRVKAKTAARALLGYVVLENMGCLLVATKVTTDGEFFWGHNVYTVSESTWIRIPLTYPAPQNVNEIANFETLSEFQLDGLHYYCETYDMTRPFPSFRDPWE